MAEARLKCLQCKKWFRGRIDKKFCSPGCKNEYHNTRKIDDHVATKKIRLLLNGNRNILRKALGMEKAVTVSHDQLLTAGYHFDYHTHHYKNWKQEEYIFCFEYGYLEMENRKYKIVKSF